MKPNPCNHNKKICEKSSFSFPSNQMSTKLLHAQMIRNNTRVTYNNSRITTIYSNILSLDYETNRNMVIQYKYTCYMRYYANLLQGNIPQSTRIKLSQMLNDILSGLSEEEYNHALQIEQPKPPPLPKMTNDSGITFYIVHRITSSRKYFIFKNMPQDFLLNLYTYYTFDISDPSNLNTKLSFSEDENSGIPYDGIYYTGTPGTPGSKMILNIYNNIKTLKLYTFNDVPMYVTLKYTWGYSIDGLLTHLYKDKQKKIYYSYLYVRQNTFLSIYEFCGPKYSMNDMIEPILFTGLNTYRYNITYGTYYLEIPEYYSATLLNKGYEDCIAFIGDDDKKKVANIYGVDFVEGAPKDGEYTFYYGKVKMIVYKPFTYPMSVYSKEFGFMGGTSIFNFIADQKENPSTDIITLNTHSYNTLQMTTMLRFNDDTSNNTKRKYGLNYGTYVIYIPPNLPIAFMNDSKEELFSINDSVAIKSGPFKAPDDNNYTFYTGTVIIQIKGNYDKISICTKNGYSGGYNLLAYTPYCGAPLPSAYKKNQGISALRVQTNMSIKEDSTTHENVIRFNDEETPTYGLYKGVYMIFNISRKCPITFLNRGKESLFTLESLLPNTTIEGFGPDDTPYTFYYGILKITVRGDFGFMSLYSMYNDYMGGFKMFSYGSFFNNSDSYPDPLSIPAITDVAPNTTFLETKIPDKLTQSLTLFNEDITIEYGNIWDSVYVSNIVYVGQRVSFYSDTSVKIRYLLNNGIYILKCVNRYITLLNKGKESLISLKGNISRKAIASDGKEYTFYTGEMIALYVFGEFEIMSLEVLGGPIGKGIFIQTTL
jgi:hypothetical protein